MSRLLSFKILKFISKLVGTSYTNTLKQKSKYKFKQKSKVNPNYKNIRISPKISNSHGVFYR